jgi:hypothetical protein
MNPASGKQQNSGDIWQRAAAAAGGSWIGARWLWGRAMRPRLIKTSDAQQ